MIGIACRYHLLFSSYGRCLYCVAFFSSRDTLLFCVVCRRNRPKEAKSPRTRPWRLNWKRRELIEVCGGAGTALTLETKLPLPHRPLRCRQVEDDQQLSSALGRHLRGLALSGAGQPGGSTPTPRLVKVALLDLKAATALHKLYPSPANPVCAWEAVTGTRGGSDNLSSRLARRHADLLQDRRIRGPSSSLPPHGHPPTTPSSYTPVRT